MEYLLSAMALFFVCALLASAVVFFRSRDFDRARQVDINGLRQDLSVVSVDVDFLFSRLAEVEGLLHNHSVLGSVETSSVKDWVSSAHAVLDDVNSRLADMQSQV